MQVYTHRLPPFLLLRLGIGLGFEIQLGIIAKAKLASIGRAVIPRADMVMLERLQGYLGIPEAGLALIFAVDRPLDMSRLAARITGNTAISRLVAKSINKLGEPEVKNWDKNYEALK